MRLVSVSVSPESTRALTSAEMIDSGIACSIPAAWPGYSVLSARSGRGEFNTGNFEI